MATLHWMHNVYYKLAVWWLAGRIEGKNANTKQLEWE